MKFSNTSKLKFYGDEPCFYPVASHSELIFYDDEFDFSSAASDRELGFYGHELGFLDHELGFQDHEFDFSSAASHEPSIFEGVEMYPIMELSQVPEGWKVGLDSQMPAELLVILAKYNWIALKGLESLDSNGQQEWLDFLIDSKNKFVGFLQDFPRLANYLSEFSELITPEQRAVEMNILLTVVSEYDTKCTDPGITLQEKRFCLEGLEKYVRNFATQHQDHGEHLESINELLDLITAEKIENALLDKLEPLEVASVLADKLEPLEVASVLADKLEPPEVASALSTFLELSFTPETFVVLFIYGVGFSLSFSLSLCLA